MKKSIYLIVALWVVFGLVHNAYAVSFGNNVGVPTVFIFNLEGLSQCGEFDSTSPGLETTDLNFTITDKGAGPAGAGHSAGRGSG